MHVHLKREHFPGAPGRLVPIILPEKVMAVSRWTKVRDRVILGLLYSGSSACMLAALIQFATLHR